MPSFKDTLNELASLFRDEDDLERQRQELLRQANMPRHWRDDRDANLQKLLEQLQGVKVDVLRNLVQFPPHLNQHFDKLGDFHDNGDYDRSVFIMTKFPREGQVLDVQLARVIDAVKESIKAMDYIPRIALGKGSRYHAMLWTNVELFLLGCAKGVAIVENRFRDDLNPNVAMEWGWMRGMGKDVLFLIDGTMKHPPADWQGLLKSRFRWDDPEDDIRKAVDEWLTKK